MQCTKQQTFKQLFTMISKTTKQIKFFILLKLDIGPGRDNASGVRSTLSRGGHFEDFVKFCPPLNQSAPGGHFALGGGILIIYTNFK